MNNRFDKQAQVKAEEAREGFNVFLIQNGQWEFMTHHRYNFFLYSLLKKGMDVEEMLHWRPEFRMKNSRKLVGSVRYLGRMADRIIESKLLYGDQEDSGEDLLAESWRKLFNVNWVA